LLFSWDGAVLAIAFDARMGMPSGTAVPVVPSGEIAALATGQLSMRLSATGTLLFAPVGFADARVVSVSREGAAVALDIPHRIGIPTLESRLMGAGSWSRSLAT
jgi:hypothetical protein